MLLTHPSGTPPPQIMTQQKLMSPWTMKVYYKGGESQLAIGGESSTIVLQAYITITL